MAEMLKKRINYKYTIIYSLNKSLWLSSFCNQSNILHTSSIFQQKEAKNLPQKYTWQLKEDVSSSVDVRLSGYLGTGRDSTAEQLLRRYKYREASSRLLVQGFPI